MASSVSEGERGSGMGRAATSWGGGQPSRRLFIAGVGVGATALVGNPARAGQPAAPQAAVERLSPEWASAWVRPATT